MSEFNTRNLKRSLPVSVITGFLAFLLSYFTLPTNIAYTFWSLILILGVSYYVMSTSEGGRRFNVSFSLVIICGLLIGGLFISPLIFTRIDNAQYFDELLIYVPDDEFPFQSGINGSELRVVDIDLAREIMDRSNTFGSNREIVSIHLGNYQNRTYWIGAAVFDGIILSDQNNRVNGFILVDITDPSKPAISIEQEFFIAETLIFNRDPARIVWQENINYELSENAYFSYNDEEDRMEYIVPYSIRDSAFLGNSHGGFVTRDMSLDGGILIFGPDGQLIRNYDASERTSLPEHAKIQLYSETWLENHIGWWGQSLVADNEVRWSTALPWVRSERLLGIDDDIRVVINPDTFQSVQYVLLDSTDSSNQILRGAIKANETGLYYYNFEGSQFIDTNSAQAFIEDEITNRVGTSTHGYVPLLPILYPVRETVTALEDYAYVMPLQLGNRFGGIAIANPRDRTGEESIIEFVDTGDEENTPSVSEVVTIAVQKYLASIDGENVTVTPPNQTTGNFTISEVREYQDDGSTVYVMDGIFNENVTNFNITGELRVIFTQELIASDELWLEVVFTDIGDVLGLILEEADGIYYAVGVEVIIRA